MIILLIFAFLFHSAADQFTDPLNDAYPERSSRRGLKQPHSLHDFLERDRWETELAEMKALTKSLEASDLTLSSIKTTRDALKGCPLADEDITKQWDDLFTNQWVNPLAQRELLMVWLLDMNFVVKLESEPSIQQFIEKRRGTAPQLEPFYKTLTLTATKDTQVPIGFDPAMKTFIHTRLFKTVHSDFGIAIVDESWLPHLVGFPGLLRPYGLVRSYLHIIAYFASQTNDLEDGSPDPAVISEAATFIHMIADVDTEQELRDLRLIVGKLFLGHNIARPITDLIIAAIEFNAAKAPDQHNGIRYELLGDIYAFYGDHANAYDAYSRGGRMLATEMFVSSAEREWLSRRVVKCAQKLRFCECRLLLMDALEQEHAALKETLTNLNTYNIALEQIVQLESKIADVSVADHTAVHAFLAFIQVKFGNLPGMECRETKNKKGHDTLSCRFTVDTKPLADAIKKKSEIERLRATIVHDVIQQVFDLSAYERYRVEYAKIIAENRERMALKTAPFRNLTLPPHINPLPPKPGPIKRDFSALCSNAEIIRNWSPPRVVYVSAATHGYPVGDLLTKYLNLSANEIHPLPWESPKCDPQPNSLFDEQPKHPVIRTVWTNLSTYPAEDSLRPYIAQLMGQNGEPVLGDFGQRIRTLMENKIGDRTILVDMAILYFRSLGLFQEAFECIVENFGHKGEWRSLASAHLANMMRTVKGIKGSREMAEREARAAASYDGVDDASLYYLAAITSSKLHRQLEHLWRSRHIDPKYEPTQKLLQHLHCSKPPKFAEPIAHRYSPICCWTTEHDVYCFRQPDKPGACFKIQTTINSDNTIQHSFRSFRCFGTYEPKCFAPPAIAELVVGFLKPAHIEKENRITGRINELLRAENEELRRKEKENPKKVFPLDYGGFSEERIRSFSADPDADNGYIYVRQYESKEAMLGNEHKTKLAAQAGDGDSMEDKQECLSAKPREPLSLVTWGGVVLNFIDGEAVKPLPSPQVQKLIWDDMVLYDTPLPTLLSMPDATLVEKGKQKLKIPTGDELDSICVRSSSRANFAPVSKYVSVTAKGQKVELHLDLEVDVSKLENLEPLCPIATTNTIPLFGKLAAYENRHQLYLYKPEKGLKDTLLSLGNKYDTVDSMGTRVHLAMKSGKKDPNAVHWTTSSVAALYWRVKGDAVNAINCLTHSLNNAPENMRDLAAISLSNIYHQSGFLNSALIAGDYALRASGGSVVAVQFNIADIYVSLKRYELATDFYYATLALQSNFQSAKDRIIFLQCLMK